MAPSRAPQTRAGDPLAALARGPLRASYLLHGSETHLLERGLALLRERMQPATRARCGRTRMRRVSLPRSTTSPRRSSSAGRRCW